jgi:hypothetical protein
MDFIDQIQALASRLDKQLDHITTEEATKNALVMPFINALGYNVFDPTEVVPEFTADVGIKKGEKVDYAIMRDGSPIMLFECKSVGANLDEVHASQLFRYFHVSSARIGVLTNGVTYRFYTDLEEPNKMDERPFLEFDMREIQDPLVSELKKLTKSTFDIDTMLSAAHDLKYTKALKKYLSQQWSHPDDEFVRFLTKRVYDGAVTQSVREQFTDIIRRALQQFVNDRVSGRLKSALREEQEMVVDLPDEETEPEMPSSNGVDTTEEELEGFRIIRAIAREVVDVGRVHQRDVKSYFGILLDDNNRKPICRLYFNTSQKYLEIFDVEGGEKLAIDSLDAIYDHAARIRNAAVRYDEQ